MKLVKFDDFFKFANFFYITVGIEPYKKEDFSKCKRFLVQLIFYAGIINMNIVLLGETLYVAMALKNGNHFLEATMNMSYIGFVLIGNFKMLLVWRQRSILRKFINGLQRIYPDSLELQQKYNLQYHLNKCNRATKSFASLYMILIWTYNLFSIIQYLIYDKLMKVPDVEQTLPYFMYIPWNWQNNWSYYLVYASEDFAGYTSAAGQISGDLLLIACTTQLVMHYDFIAHTIVSYEIKLSVQNVNKKKDMDFLRNIIQYHSYLFDLSEQVNKVFGVPLLFSFATSSFVICFVGFQMTTGAPLATLFKLFLFLFSSIAQIYLICDYGQLLIDASVKVAASVYNQNWSNADVCYQKMLILITNRAQKPVQLKATTFVLISRGTMTEIMQLSYKFFALLRTMYVK